MQANGSTDSSCRYVDLFSRNWL